MSTSPSTRRGAGTLWRSPEELGEDPAALTRVEGEFPFLADGASLTLDRRRVLHLMAASLALGGLGGCDGGSEERVPYVETPDGVVPGRSRLIASALTRDGYGIGILVAQRMGRPIKLDGNPDHPASLGGSDPILQAEILNLYDTERSRLPLQGGRPTSMDGFARALAARLADARQKGGAALRILADPATSPTLERQKRALLERYPAARWHRWTPLSRHEVRRGAELAFGRVLETVPRIERCAVVLAVESDLFDGAPGHLNFARAFARRRQPGDDMLRLYALESTPTLVGANADHRFMHAPIEIDAALRAVATELGVGQGLGDVEKPGWVAAVARDLERNRGRALLHAGAAQPASVHALVHAINDALGAPVDHFAPIEPEPADEGTALESLVEEMRAGAVDTLLVLGANPVFTAPADLDFAGALRQVPMSVHLGLHVDETARACTWHLPQAHELEAWSDTLAFDGTATIMQPSVRPLFGGWSAHEVIALALGDARPDGRAIVRETWAQKMGSEGFESTWVEALRRGVVAGSAAQTVAAPFQKAALASLPAPTSAPGAGVLTALFRPDPFVRDGRHANNAWLQELPRPITKLTWGNAAQIAPTDAARLGLSSGDVVVLRTRETSLRAPVWILPGQAQGCVTLPFGFGRSAAGRVAEGAGFDAFRLRTRAQPWSAPSLTLVRTGERQLLAATQLHGSMEGRDPIHVQTLEEYRSGERKREAAPEPSLYPPVSYPRHAWAMAIDLNRCIGCSACTAACQAENNIPVVGKEEMIRGREMHWIRVDRYYAGPVETPETHFQPVPCMHCERAPCEVVCPVEATVHDSSGLNVMVYNRCVGTRFCSNNCPYKVRRFNFFNYAADDQRLALSWNPEVSVRARGVMEKCTYCIQRIRQGQIDADRDGRTLGDGDIVTACQAACPTEAIVFGDLNDRDSAVNQRKASPLDYALLEELGTRPRTTYSAAIVNPNPDLKDT